MNAEIVMIGTELLLGQIVDTNAAFLGRMLAENGVPLYQKVTVGDNLERIVRVLNDALSRADLVLTSGGLGPTEDDLTREAIAEALGRPLEFRVDLMAQVEARFARMRRPMTENNRKQAMAPCGAEGILNPHGTAPGILVEDPRGIVIAMPGVPWELEPMLMDRVLPYVRTKFGMSGIIHSRVLKVAGIGESRVDAAIGDLIRELSNPTIGELASPDVVRIRITARAETVEEAERMIEDVDAQVRRRLPGCVYGVDDDTLEGVTDTLLAQRGWRLAVVETITGGVLAHRLTEAGAKSFAGGMVVPRGESFIENARRDFAADAVLALIGESADQMDIVFDTPAGRVHWPVEFGSTGASTAVRLSAVAVEQVRRYLLELTPLELSAKRS